ncbi:SepM family pheromone-processing serine protease [Pseudogracilibacillus sp. SE30717A]|uniref:SepM family pheromone-processing serine protease n=1 Tax=Pseudogracilibacillus sp. SE30717A TaxID=3098293 RepID=UPI00300E2E26
MRITKRTLVYSFIITLTFFLLFTLDLPYYIYKPGHADSLENMVEIENGYQGKGDLHLVTVSGGQATPIQYILAKFMNYNEIVPIEEARPEGMTDNEYMRHQLMLMENSQQSSTVVAYRAAGKKYSIEYNGIYIIGVVENMPADEVLEPGDRITHVDGKQMKEANEMVEYVQMKKDGDKIELDIDRNGKQMKKTIKVESFADQEEKVGIGIQLVTDQEVVVDPPVHIKSGNIGGPSAGLMFSLEIYNRLTEEDITKGYHIAGTGEIDFDGNVLRIGGIDKKVVAAHREGIEIFFAPNEKGNKESNYQVAKKTAEQIGTKMKIVPIDTFDDALAYLNQLEPK